MMHDWKKKIAGALAVCLLAACLAGCNVNAVTNEPTDPTGTDPQTTEPPTTEPPVVITTDPTKPADSPAIDRPIVSDVQGTAQLKQIRLGGYDKNWVANFGDILGEFAIINDYDSLVSAFAAVDGMGRTVNFPGEYDAAFFAENRLVLIPSGSSSGSVRYVADAVWGDNKIVISLQGKMPDVGTADMADWLLLITLPRDQFPEDMPIEVHSLGSQNTGIKDNLNISDR